MVRISNDEWKKITAEYEDMSKDGPKYLRREKGDESEAFFVGDDNVTYSLVNSRGSVSIDKKGVVVGIGKDIRYYKVENGEGIAETLSDITNEGDFDKVADAMVNGALASCEAALGHLSEFDEDSPYNALPT